MPKPAIKRGSDYFFTALYEGNGQGQKVGNFIPFTDNGTIAKSCMFDDGSSSYLSRTHSASNKKTFTFSAWIKRCATGAYQRIFNATDAGDNEHLIFRDTNVLHFYSGDATIDVKTNRTFEDTSKFYHIVLRVDTTQATAANRVRLYVDGDEITSLATATYPAQDADTAFNGNVAHDIGRSNSSSQYFDGYMAEVNFMDGQSYGPDTFGITDTSTGRWIPKSLGSITYGTNGFRLTFANGAGQTIGDDTSGNGNDFTVSGMGTDHITTDSPTQNFTTLDAGNSGSMTLSEGNLRYTTASSSNWESVYSDKSINTGKWYFEVTCKVTTAYDAQPGVILESVLSTNKNQLMGYSDGSVGYNMDNAQNTLYYGNSGNDYLVHSATDASTAGVVMGVAYDADTGAMWFAKNNTWVNNGTGTGNPSTGANPVFIEPKFAKQNVRFGFSTYNASASYEINFGAKDFNYTPPTDFNKVQQDNLTDDGKGIPDLVWIKNRDATDSHQLYDSSRGVQKDLNPDATDQEGTTTDGLQKFLKGGCAVEDDVSVNTSGESYVAWNWVANNGVTATNNDGETTSTIQVNDTAGFSIGTFTSKVAEQTIGHGLGAKPDFILLKRRDGSQNWMAYHSALSSSDAYYLHLNNTDAQQTGSDFGNDVPTTTVFHTNVTGVADRTFCFWAFKNVDGFSDTGKYSGNGLTDGPFIYTGFKPSWLMIKRSDSSTGANWSIADNTRHITNPVTKPLMPNATDAESSLSDITMDMLSNGFKIRNTLNSMNNSSGTYVYIAFAEHPFIGDGTNPATAR